MFEIFGYERGEIVPTLELGMAHLEPSEQAQAQNLWETLLAEGGPIAGYHTIIDAHQRGHRVLTVADRITNEEGDITGVRGFFTDITGPIHEDSERIAADSIARSMENQAVIEQAKGLLMAVQSITADQAFLVLSRHSQSTDQKITHIAQELIDTSGDHRDLAAATHTMFSTP